MLHIFEAILTLYFQYADRGVFLERPLSSASTQTEDTEELVELSGRLVRALNKEDSLRSEHQRLGEVILWIILSILMSPDCAYDSFI